LLLDAIVLLSAAAVERRSGFEAWKKQKKQQNSASNACDA
jgi:hypothetical protein